MVKTSLAKKRRMEGYLFINAKQNATAINMKNTTRKKLERAIGEQVLSNGPFSTFKINSIVVDGEYTVFLHDVTCGDFTVFREYPDGIEKFDLLADEIEKIKKL